MSKYQKVKKRTKYVWIIMLLATAFSGLGIIIIDYFNFPQVIYLSLFVIICGGLSLFFCGYDSGLENGRKWTLEEKVKE